MITEVDAHAAVEAKDRRYDGRFFIGVTSTGVYCRCVCPARTPKPANRRFFPSAAAAEAAGFRPCLLCRPERAPGFAPIDQADRLAGDALKRIEAGALEEDGLAALAAQLGVTDRHLRRVVLKAFGASPIALAQTHRLLTAKRLLHETRLTMAQIAFASGFQSVRRFNATFQQRYRLAPSALRRAAGQAHGELSLQLAARGKFHPQPLLESLQGRSVDGLETLDANIYRRTLQIGAHAGVISVAPNEDGVRLEISESLFPALRRIVADVRSAYDLNADLDAIDAHLNQIAPLRAARALRLHGELDPFETAIRTVLGQQVTRAAARTLCARLVKALGAPIETGIANLSRLFPTPAAIAAAPIDQLAGLGLPRRRAATLQALAQAVADGRCVLQRGATAAGRAGLAAIPGIGPWTINYVALRGLGDPDSFPAGDAVLDKIAAGLDLETARPWRSYAAIRLWAIDAAKGATP